MTSVVITFYHSPTSSVAGLEAPLIDTSTSFTFDFVECFSLSREEIDAHLLAPITTRVTLAEAMEDLRDPFSDTSVDLHECLNSESADTVRIPADCIQGAVEFPDSLARAIARRLDAHAGDAELQEQACNVVFEEAAGVSRRDWDLVALCQIMSAVHRCV